MRGSTPGFGAVLWVTARVPGVGCGGWWSSLPILAWGAHVRSPADQGVSRGPLGEDLGRGARQTEGPCWFSGHPRENPESAMLVPALMSSSLCQPQGRRGRGCQRMGVM